MAQSANLLSLDAHDCRYSIRIATVNDADGILNCLQLAFEPFRERYTKPAYDDTVLTAATVRQRLSSMQIYVAVTDTNEVIGSIACNVIGQEEGHLRGMAVLEQWQGTGVADALLKMAETTLVQSNCSFISLDTTTPLERAIHFYEKHGFHPTGTIRDFFGMPLYQYAKAITT